MMEAPGADSEEKHEPVSDIDTVVVDSLKALDPNGRLEKRPVSGELESADSCQKEPSRPLSRTLASGVALFISAQ